jgi:excisionase family DNA binding protein
MILACPLSCLNVTSSGPDPGGAAGLQAYTVEQVAEMLNVSRDKVSALLRTGELRSIKIGNLRRITEQHLAEFIASLEERTS